MTYDNWKADDRNIERQDPESEPIHERDLTMEALSQLPAPLMSMNDVTERLARGEKYRLALREVYRYVDELDEAMRETGVCPVDHIEIVDEVKRLITRVHT